MFKDTVTSLMDQHIPSKMSKANQSKSWITNDIRRKARKKQRMYNKAVHSQKSKDWEEYKLYQKDLQKKVRHNYWNYQNKMCCEQEDKSNKSFWSFIRSKRQENTTISSLKDGSKVIFSAKGKATAFNNTFKSVFTCEDRDNMPDLGDPVVPPMDCITVTPDGVLKLMQEIKIRKATGPDMIPARILKDYATELAPILTFIFQQSLDSGCVPSDWRVANIVPIYKKGDKSIPSNYRPVSITSICSKLIEHIIFSQVMEHYDDHQILVNTQHGFRPGRSCETQLIITTHDLASALDNRQQVDAVVLDFSKAFDHVPHQRLLQKLHHYGINTSLLHWIENFLTTRSQRVVIDGESSDFVPVTSGVPQGTVLGPLLFLSFINDIQSGITSRLRLFADDCLMYRPINSANDCHMFQQDLDRLHQWSTTWQMQFNTDKCHIIRFSLLRNNILTDYHLGDSLLTMVSEYPYLGLTLSSNLSWQLHINNVTKKANRILGLLQRNLRGCSKKMRQQAYISLVRPHLECSCAVWSPYITKDISRVEMVQRRAARFVLQNYRRRASVSSMLQVLEWDTLEKRRQAASLVLMYNIHSETVAINPAYYITPRTPAVTRNYHPYQYQIIPARIQLYQNSFFPRTVIWWNALPVSVVISPSVEVFREAVTSCI